MQQVLFLTTDGCTLRSKIVGWSMEDPSLYVPNKPIGLTPGVTYNCDTVLEAMADNWHLLAPPVLSDDPPEGRYYDWCLVRKRYWIAQ